MSNASLELGGDNWAAKDGNLLGYAVGDSSGKYVPREFTFTRGSNLAATRVNAQGLIEKGRENRLEQSNNFDTTWSTTNSNVTSGQSGYDGSSDAWLLSKSGANGRVQQFLSKSGVQTFSVYAKANTATWLKLQAWNGSSFYTTSFNLSSGALGSLSNLIDANTEDIGGGWYRCSISLNASIQLLYIYPAAGDNDTAATSGSIYIQDAQLEQGLVATEYIETGANPVQAGLLEAEPRIDYTGGTGSLLLEPSRTQLITQSEYFGAWSNARTIDTDNQAISPEGLNNASYLEQQSGQTSAGSIYLPITFGSTADYTTSIFAKKAEKDFIVAYDKNANRTYFNLSTGNVGTTPTGVTASIEDFGNGWYKCSATFNASVGNGNIAWYLGDTNNSATVVDNGGVYIYGAQLEEGSYPTSYIPNHSGGSVTRGVDFTTKTGLTSSINSTEGTMFLDFKALANTLPSEYSHFSMSNGTYNNRIAIFQSTGATNEVRVLAFVGGTKVFDLNGSVTDITTQTKVALRYAENAFDLFINGAKVATDTSGSIFPANTLDRVSFSEIGTTAKTFKGKVKQALVFPTALSDAQCSALTVEGLKEEILTSYIAAVDTLEDGAEARLDTYLQNLEDLIV